MQTGMESASLLKSFCLRCIYVSVWYWSEPQGLMFSEMFTVKRAAFLWNAAMHLKMWVWNGHWDTEIFKIWILYNVSCQKSGQLGTWEQVGFWEQERVCFLYHHQSQFQQSYICLVPQSHCFSCCLQVPPFTEISETSLQLKPCWWW